MFKINIFFLLNIIPGKKDENIIIKGNSGNGHCCHQDVHHKEEHVPHPIPIHLNAASSRMHSTYLPVPLHFKKKEVHHTKQVHHRDDQPGVGSRRKDAANNYHNDTVSTAGKLNALSLSLLLYVEKG